MRWSEESGCYKEAWLEQPAVGQQQAQKASKTRYFFQIQSCLYNHEISPPFSQFPLDDSHFPILPSILLQFSSIQLVSTTMQLKLSKIKEVDAMYDEDLLWKITLDYANLTKMQINKNRVYIQRGKPDERFPLFEPESLKWPGFVEFDDINEKVLTYSTQDR
ncbi:unnamed protein product [Lactuca virosa]|uniref:Uncharacterized protein n=1 Tax=Lactuca virosa TaxID=75947 RepID=A0AAU9MSF7_9ASTR|nr:unnamed protein product [Lactuca virosa]